MINELETLLETLKKDRDEINLKLHLATMELKDEFNSLEDKWDLVVKAASEAASEAAETSDEVFNKAKLVGDELKDTYQRIRTILSA
ncbi:MAG: hypothetical protein ACU836_13825 [Gammaproteobacteria bacterium]